MNSVTTGAGDEQREPAITDGALAVVIVTYNSRSVIQRCIESLLHGRLVPGTIIVVDSCSPDQGYLDDLQRSWPQVHVLRLDTNVGFCRANNLGYRAVPSHAQYIAFVNPDLFVDELCLATALSELKNGNEKVGVVTGRLRGYSQEEARATGLLDSCGIDRTWYGRYFDRGQGQPDDGRFEVACDVLAACGALMICRREALESTSLAGQIFDERFYMYKEDIDLSLRVRRAGWRIVYQPRVTASHCRGWNASRKNVALWARRISVRNDWLLLRRRYQNLPSSLITAGYLLLKSLYVRIER